MLLYLILAAWLILGVGSYLCMRWRLRLVGCWTRVDRLFGLALSCFGPISVLIVLLLCGADWLERHSDWAQEEAGW